MELKQVFPIFDRLEEADQNTLSASARALHFKRGDMIYAGDKCMGLLLICAGQVRAFTTSRDGKEITLYRLFERDMCLFSASCMMRSIQFDIALRAEKDTDVILIPADIYREMMERSAPLANYTNEIMATRFSEVMWLMEQIMWESLDRRLAEFLLNEASLEDTHTLKLTHEEIGNHLGSPREVVTRMLKYFQNEGAVKLSRGMITLTDIPKLTQLSEP